ncbi:MAG: nitrogenase cofactor biosynthesis protein NifB [Clostridia bacterium]|nr:nitrogenase cofactor biosynthesis protein NifB [Clostridia bacterium]
MKNRNLVNLNMNPCKMCMPMGSALAFKGISSSMFMLHGSQGCSTYIRRHMAGHFNEPVDIASSSLNEEGTVYGGESNLKKGLRNLIKLYRPEVIGVGTTCLAETIGEDINRIINEFSREEDCGAACIIPISTPGYGGTQFEGYYSAILSIVKAAATEAIPNDRVNVIAPNVSPGDIRNLKAILEDFGIDYILLPDISETLDAPYSTEYRRIPSGGSKLEDLRKMAGARATIEFGLTVPDSLSPGTYLKERFGIPLFKCPIPLGLEYTDIFMKVLSELSGRLVPGKYISERGRLIDGMIDSHKHNAEGRAVIYGEPEQVLAISKLCCESGVKPVLVSTGSNSDQILPLINAMGYFNDFDEKLLVLKDTDFETIQKLAVQQKANILIGNSDGKFITEKEGIPLVRTGFPIHDRMGGQRLVHSGYGGSLKLLDDITNTLIENKYEKYRENTFQRYYSPKKHEDKTNIHPCFSSLASKNARMHIPVAPTCNISCNYCNRKYDCQNESRPGVTSAVLSPEEAAAKFAYAKDKVANLTVVGIAGPGDALANFPQTRKSIELIKQIDTNITFCLSTNGLMLPRFADEIIEIGVSHVTVTINSVDPEIGARIYKEVNYAGKKHTGAKAAEILIKNQLEGLSYLASRGVLCKVNIVMIKGVNDSHIEEVVKKVKACGAFMTNIMPLIPAEGSAFQNIPLTSSRELNEMRKKCEADIKQMYHCRQCRADAIGTLDDDRSAGLWKGICKGFSGSESRNQKVCHKLTRGEVHIEIQNIYADGCNVGNNARV